jgi:type VI secretion system protein ImpC
MEPARTADPDCANLLQRAFAPRVARLPDAKEADRPPDAWIATLARYLAGRPGFLAAQGALLAIEAIIADVDAALSAQLNFILHAPEFQALEATWRGLHLLVRSADRNAGVKVKALDIGKRELSRTLRKFHGNAWDQSPIFRRVYEEEFGQFGGEPYALLVGDYGFDHQPGDVAMLADMGQIAAAAHAPFISAAAPSLLNLDSWAEVANPRDVTRIFQNPEYLAWRALREQEDARYIGLCMPRFLARLPYGAATDPLDDFAFEEDTTGSGTSSLLWGNAAFAFGANVAQAFAIYGWCARIRGVDRGGVVEGLPVLHHSTADGDTDRRTVTEVCLSERRDADLAFCGLIPLVHRKNSDVAAFISAQSLQKSAVYQDGDATANAALSARLPYLLNACRFAHYLKCMVRGKIGAGLSRSQISSWLTSWLIGYVDGSPATSSEEFKAAHPLRDARLAVEERADMPGHYEARVFLSPHYQLEGLNVALRLVSQLSTV